MTASEASSSRRNGDVSSRRNDGVSSRRISGRRGFTLWIVTALVGWGIDAGTKQWALSTLPWGTPIPFIGELLQLHLIANPGAAFSLGAGHTWIFTVLSFVVLAFVVALARTLRHTGWALTLGIITAGILGNLTDRLFRPPGFAVGHVIDFLRLPAWPIFNVADICVTLGAVALVIVWFRSGVGPDGLPDNVVVSGENPKGVSGPRGRSEAGGEGADA